MQAAQYHNGEGYQEVRYASPAQHVFVPNAAHLPAVRGENMQSPGHFAPMPMNGAPMQQHPPHPPPYNPNHFHYQNGVVPPPPMPASLGIPGQNGMMRFPIPPPPIAPGEMAGGRHSKKEIRRRTKSGCLTCRKRRIKCDEGHPTCRNCQKSKRECLGYDPIFKQHSGHAPIQPAPANSVTPTIKPTTSPISTTYQQVPSYPVPGGSFLPAPNHSQPLDSAFEYPTSLDPALSTTEQGLTMAANSFSTTLHPTRKVVAISVEQLFSLNDVPPRYESREAPPPDTTTSQHEIDDLYRYHFAQGLDKLFETTWYSSCGLTCLQQDPPLSDFVAQCVEQFKTQDPSATQSLQSLEARLVWQLATMPRSAPPNDQLTLDLLLRIDIIEHLLTGQHLPRDSIPPPPTAAQSNDAIKYNEVNFWHQLGSFTSHPDDNPDPLVTQAINENLNTMRGILGIMENRDVLYSLAIARYIGGRMDEFHPRQPLVSPSNDANDEVNKLEVARRHVDVEDQKGTTQVIQRICGMAIRSWILQKR